MRPRPRLDLVDDAAVTWHRDFVPKGRYISEVGINTKALEQNFPAVMSQLRARHMEKLLACPGKANLSMIRELYANWHDGHATASVRGIEIKMHRSDICHYLGVEDVDPTRLKKFVKSRKYKLIRHTLCGVDSTAKWVKQHGTLHLHMVRSDFNKTAKVWQNFVQPRLMPAEHISDCTRARVCVIYFLMTGRPINVGELILGEMARTGFGRQIRWFFFGNLLTRYMLDLGVPEYLGYDEVVEASPGLMDITILLEPASKLTPAARYERDESFSRYIYRTLNFLMCKASATDVELMELRSELSSSAKEMLGIAPGSPVHSSEDVNAVRGSNSEEGEEVTGPRAVVPLGPDDDEPADAALET